MARRIIITLLLTAGAALQQPNIQPRALSPQKAVPCAEADALLAQARHLRDQAEIEERQLRALRAEAVAGFRIAKIRQDVRLKRGSHRRRRLGIERRDDRSNSLGEAIPVPKRGDRRRASETRAT